jgi:ABC-type histidine transport system, ATPase component
MSTGMALPIPYKLTAEDVHKRYGMHEVLKGVSLKAKAGDVISLVGSSGSGKSTFLRCINFLEHPTSGRSPWTVMSSRPCVTARARCASRAKVSCAGSAPGSPWCSSISTCGRI